MEDIAELATRFFENTTDDIYVQNPCQVVGVHGNYVDVLLFINDDEPDTVIYNVPIIRPETQRAYIFLGISEGDRGVCRFFDRSTEAYLQSDFDYNSDERQHDINDRCFELGFLPDKETFVYPTDQEIEIGLKNNSFKISVMDDSTILINGRDITVETVALNINATKGVDIDAPSVNVTGEFNVGNGYTGLIPCGSAVLNIQNGIIIGVS